MGLFVGVRLHIPPARVVKAAIQDRLLLVAAGDKVVRMLPPLNASRWEVEWAVKLLARTLDRVEKEGAK
jgi:acetylornithine/succinyldiaminopimelate/putrescine aminotransferase